VGARGRYNDEFRAEALAALAANGGNLKRTARQLGLPRKTLEGWASGRTLLPPADLRHQKKGRLAEALESVARELLVEASRPEKIAAASLLDLVVMSGIAVDKMLLLCGDDTLAAARRGSR
jgi:transposase-like protein